ncbi:MAG TPA: peptidoglycan-binding domain-containing protein [Nitrospiraceae bacterium]
MKVNRMGIGVMREEVFQKALQSRNLHAISDVALIFHGMGEHEKCQALADHVHKLSGVTVSFGHEFSFGVDYAAVQAKLNEKGATPKLVVDGIWGAKSKAALIAYQKANKLVADGIPGPISLGSLGIPNAGGSSTSVASTMGQTSSASAARDAQAYAVAKAAAPQLGMTERQVQYALTVGRGEGHYGDGWKNPSAATIEKSKKFGLTGYEGADSNNWGATQGTGDAGSFPHVDSGWMVPDENGKPTNKHWVGGTGPKVWGDYVANYKKWSTPEKGFLDMAKVILNGGKRGAAGAAEIKAAIERGHLADAVKAQHANGYFELDPNAYLTAMVRNYNSIIAGIGWPKVLDQYGVTKAIAATGAFTALGAIGAFILFLFRKKLGF